MLRLPSGRIIGIMSERARMHATRQKLRITTRTPHHQLYPLVDILVETPHGSAPFGFSGHTLADTAWLSAWPEADRQTFLAWLGEAAQRHCIEQARRRLLAEESAPKEQSYPYPEQLYSTLHRGIEATRLNRAEAGQWRHTLLNMQRQGIRSEELTWSGLLTFLAEHRGRVIERTELLQSSRLDSIRLRLGLQLACGGQCRLPMQELVERLPAWRMRMAGLDVADRDVGVLRKQSADGHYRIGLLWPGGHALAEYGQARWFVFGPYGRALSPAGQSWFASLEQAGEVARQHALQNHRLRWDLENSRRYEHMTLSGGDDYSEWLVTLPDYQHSYFNGHYYERNVLLHIRSKRREALDGTQVLFIEEIQSDWHQADRQQVRGQIPRAPFRREWPALALKLMLMHAARQGLDAVAWSSGRVHELRYDKAMPGLCRLYDDELPRVAARLAKHWQSGVVQGVFQTRHPWLHATRQHDKWKVEGAGGKFATRARYDRTQALALIERHSKVITLGVPMLRINQVMRAHLIEHGLPLFGEML